MYETGVRVYDEEGVQVAYEGGAIVEDTQKDNSLVKIPPWLVDKALATLPRKVVVRGPDRKHKMELYKDSLYFGAGSDTPFTIDPYTGKRRRATYKDVRNFARLAQALPNIDFVMSMVLPGDVDQATADIYQMEAMLNYTTKPIMYVTTEFRGCVDVVEMAEVGPTIHIIEEDYHNDDGDGGEFSLLTADGRAARS